MGRSMSHRPALKRAEEKHEVVLLANSTAKKSSFSSEIKYNIIWINVPKCWTLKSPRKMSLGDLVPFTKAVKTADLARSESWR